MQRSFDGIAPLTVLCVCFLYHMRRLTTVDNTAHKHTPRTRVAQCPLVINLGRSTCRISLCVCVRISLGDDQNVWSTRGGRTMVCCAALSPGSRIHQHINTSTHQRCMRAKHTITRLHGFSRTYLRCCRGAVHLFGKQSAADADADDGQI